MVLPGSVWFVSMLLPEQSTRHLIQLRLISTETMDLSKLLLSNPITNYWWVAFFSRSAPRRRLELCASTQTARRIPLSIQPSLQEKELAQMSLRCGQRTGSLLAVTFRHTTAPP